MTDAKLIDPVPRKESGYRAEYRVNLPENAFFNVGDIDDVKAKARTMKRDDELPPRGGERE